MSEQNKLILAQLRQSVIQKILNEVDENSDQKRTLHLIHYVNIISEEELLTVLLQNCLDIGEVSKYLPNELRNRLASLEELPF